MDDDESRRTLNNGKARAEAQRNVAVTCMRTIYDLGKKAKADPDVFLQTFLANVGDLESLWVQFKTADSAFLDCLIALGRHAEHAPELTAEVRGLINCSRALAKSLSPVGDDRLNTANPPSSLVSTSPSRLPEIPLPKFNGDLYHWPTFRDRFTSLVDGRSGLSNIDKMYYLIGCLHGPALDVIRGIPVSAENYDLAWSTLSERFHRPRVVATSLVDKLLSVPVSNQESLQELNMFVSTFAESIALLENLKIPDLGSFVLFSLAFRSLPMVSRKLFESNSSSDYPTISELMKFVRSRITVLENVGNFHNLTVNTKPSSSGVTANKGKFGRSSPTTLMVTKPLSTAVVCPCCEGNHTLVKCTQFQSWSIDTRNQWARDHRLCFSCLGDNHWSNKCKSGNRCNVCSRKHHTLLHGATSVQSSVSTTQPNGAVCAAASLPRVDTSTSVMLGTALVHVCDRSGTWHTMRALIDSASQISAMTSACANQLGLRRTPWTTPVTGLSGLSVNNVQGRVVCRIQPRFSSDPILSVNAWVLPIITGQLPRQSLSSGIKDRYSNLALADPSFNIAAPVDLLLGADIYSHIMDGRKVTVDEALPSAFSSIFGWILIGPIPLSDIGHYQSFPVSLTISIESLMDKFWHIEEPASAPITFTDHGRCEEIVKTQYVRLPSGRFAVPLPFRRPVSDNTFVGSRDMAVKRFESLERRLASNPKLRSLYVEFMSEYLTLGHMSVAQDPGCYFIPHHAVYQPHDVKPKLRVVFDASAQCAKGPSLNSCMFSGPKLQQDIVDVLTRFRVPRHAFTADICKMYRQVLILPEYRKYQHIFWRSSPHDKLVEYELNTVTYGMSCAPFLALRVLQSIASTDCGDSESVRDALVHQTYVDDICVGADTVDEALELQSSLISILGKSGFDLKKWSSNTPEILDAVLVDDRVDSPLVFDTEDGDGTKVLGLEWHQTGDYFSCAFRLDVPPVFTKRGVLSLVARIFDPLGFFGPTVFLAKCLMQRTWQSGISWDDPLPADIHLDWSSFVSELPSLVSVRIPRYFNTQRKSSCYLLGFCDASQRGYAAVVYLRCTTVSGEPSVHLIGTKTKVAPLKSLTVPRLELSGALLLSRWLSRIRDVLSLQLDIVDVFVWTDSTIVLSWLQVPHESFKTYVSNRVHQIQSLLPQCRWNYIESSHNPADCASRGVMPSELAQLALYWKGPSVVYASPSVWDSSSSFTSLIDLPELKPVSLTALCDDGLKEWFIRFSSYDHMVRLVARLCRFVDRCRNHGMGPFLPPFLRRSELDGAERLLVLESQRIHFDVLLRDLSHGNRVSSRPLARLAPFVDVDGVIRVGGRLRHSSLSFEHKHPILVAKGSHLALLLCRKWHKITCHAGPRVLTALISRQYWIVALRSILHRVISNCTICVRLDAKPPHPLMADLPLYRIQQYRPFARVGIDFAGPLQMRELRLRKARTYKVYIAVFVCFAVKAVHLELVSDLSTDAFLAAFDRFVARRGLPSDVFSDCGTNFIGANKLLHGLVNSPEGQIAVANSRPTCEWHFNPPSAPHFGGLWEAAVRSTKRLLIRVIGTHTFTYEEFTTILARIEAVLNSRPLIPASNDPHDLECLSPGHFLIGQPLLAVPPRSNPDTKLSLTHRWKLLDQCHQAFWKRWSSEYLTTLQERSKWVTAIPNIKVDDMVVVIDNQSPPLAWRLGRIVELFPGPDGTVRVARVLTNQGPITRPVVKLIALPTQRDQA